jgi:predicted nucleic acid-binding Zn ribbon protein
MGWCVQRAGEEGVGRMAWGGAMRRAEQAAGVPCRGTGATVKSVRKKGKKKREKKKKVKGKKKRRKNWKNFGKN